MNSGLGHRLGEAGVLVYGDRQQPLPAVSPALTGVFVVALPTSEFTNGGKTIEAFTLEDKSNNSYEILFIDKATQKAIGSYSVRIDRFNEKGIELRHSGLLRFYDRRFQARPRLRHEPEKLPSDACSY